MTSAGLLELVNPKWLKSEPTPGHWMSAEVSGPFSERVIKPQKCVVCVIGCENGRKVFLGLALSRSDGISSGRCQKESALSVSDEWQSDPFKGGPNVCS